VCVSGKSYGKRGKCENVKEIKWDKESKEHLKFQIGNDWIISSLTSLLFSF